LANKMKPLRTTLVLLALLNSCSFASSEAGIFDQAPIQPPNLPAASSNGTQGRIVFTLVDIESGQCAGDLHVEVNQRNETGPAVQTLRYAHDCNVTFDISPGRWTFILKLDSLATRGKDYFATTTFTYPEEKDAASVVYLKPVGSVIGTVADSDGKILPGSRVKLDCSSDYFPLDEVTTDEYGNFKANWLPQGTCKISALYDNAVGSTNVDIKKGKLTDVKITIDGQNAVWATKWPYLLVAGVLGSVLALSLALRLGKRPAGLEDKRASIPPTKGMLAIIETLPEEQKIIVKALLEAGGKLRQADICLATCIPKASLSRYIFALESRKVISCNQVGNTKDVRLSEWFLKQ
jgi:hypothetical protein